MIFKTLGNTGVKIPAIAQGTTGIGNYANFDPDLVSKRIDVLKYGIDLGINFIDTAELYGGGFVEETLGKVLNGMRDKIFLASKFNPKEDVSESIPASLENSLKRLRTDHLDLYQIHWPNPSVPIDKIMQALSKIVEQGKTRFVGASNFCVEDFKAAQSFFGDKIVSNQLEYNLLDRSVEDDFLPYCADNRISLLAYSPLNHGKVHYDDEQKAILSAIAHKYNKTISQIVLRWLIGRTPVVVVTKTRSMEHTKENALSADFDLREEDVSVIDGLSKQHVVRVLTSSINLSVSDKKPVYGTLEEAMENRLDLIPSPVNLAKNVSENKNIKPIRLKPSKDTSGKYSYDIDDYDIMDEVKKYWAWVIAYGWDRPIPAFVL
ncbi:MAG: aldo/keto reductase [Syntrophales bacterium]